MQKPRNFARLKTRHEARVSFSSEVVVSCEIRDFCQTGFYLRLQEKDSARVVEPSLNNTLVMVEFTAPSNGGTQEFKVMGRVAHFSAAGLGIFSESMSDQAFQGLLKFRADLYRSAGDAKPAYLDPVDGRTIQIQCLSLYRPFLSRVIHEFFSMLKGRSAEEFRSSLSLSDQYRFLDGLGEIKVNQEPITRRFTESALSRFEPTGAQDSRPTKAESMGLELSLVEKDDFDDWLNLASIINKLEVRLQDQAGNFERLFKLLIGRFAELAEEEDNLQDAQSTSSPFSPAAVCGAFQEALRGMALDTTQRALFYKVFGQAVAVYGEEFYEGLSKVASVAERRKNRAGSGPRRRVSDRVPVTTPDTMGYSLDNTLAALNQQENEGDTLPTEAGAKDGDKAVSAATVADEAGVTPSLIFTTGQLLNTVNQLVRQVPDVSAPPAQMPGPQQTAHLPLASTSEMLVALDALFKARANAQPAVGQSSMTAQLHSQLARLKPGQVHITRQQQQTLDSLASLYDGVMREYSKASELEGLLKQFEPLFFRLAFSDPEFLATENHPARKVLNLLDKFAIACDDNGQFFDPKLRQALTFLIDNISAKLDPQPDIMQKAEQTLDKMLTPLVKVRRRRVQRLQEMCEGKGRVLRARWRVMNELEARLGGRSVPSVLLHLLDADWRQYLSLLELRGGLDSEEWKISIAMVERLRDWLSPGFTPEADFPAQARALMLELRRRLATICIDSSQLESVLTDLERLLASRAEDPDAPVDMRHLEPGRLLLAFEDEEVELPEDSPLRNQLVLGGWWNIAHESGKAAPMQLIWLSQPPGSCAFANRSATRKIDLTLSELAHKHEVGDAMPATDKEIPLLERSEASLVDVVYKQLAHQSTHDPVTDLINHKGLLQNLLKLAAKTSGDQIRYCLSVIEFSQIRAIAHQHGLSVQDKLMRQLAHEMRQRLHADVVLGTLRDDSFVAYLPNCDEQECQHIFGEFIEWLKTYRFETGTGGLGVGANVGLVGFFPGSLHPEEILRRADAACMHASSTGRNVIQVYTPDDAALQTRESLIEWAGRIDQILDGDGLYLRCQLVSPVREDTDCKPYYEILLGVRDPEGRNVAPQQFVLAVEAWNRVHDIDRWVVANTFHWVRENPEAFDVIGGFSVNLSAQSLNNADLLAFLHQELSRPGVPLDKIMFEITETGTIGCYAAAQEFIRQIRHYGCKFAIDDFGSGYASYGHLKNLKTDTIKIDGIFIKDMLNNPADYAMVKSMKEIGHSLGMRVVAEFVATPEILEAVREIGVDYVQGYALHEPMPLADLASAISSNEQASLVGDLAVGP